VNRNAVKIDSFFDHISVVTSYKDSGSKNDTLYFFENNKNAIQLGKIATDTNVLKIDTDFVYSDTLYTYTLTNRANNIESYKIKHRTGQILELYRLKNRYYLYALPIPKNIPAAKVTPGKGADFLKKTGAKPEENVEPQPRKPARPHRLSDTMKRGPVTQVLKKDTSKRQVKSHYFQTEFPVPVFTDSTGPRTSTDSARKTVMQLLSPTKPVGYIKFPSPLPYFLSFQFDAITTQLENGIITFPYVPYVAGDNSFMSPAISGLIKIGVSDMFKDYRIIGGFSVSANLNGAQYFLSYENLKERLDKKLIFLRSGETKSDNGTNYYRLTSNELRTQLKYPFSETTSLRGDIFGRLDRKVFLTGEQASLVQPSIDKIWAGGKLEYVFDNTINFGQNLYYGTRLKLYSEFYDQVNARKNSFQTFGADIRTYTKISRQIIWANRLSAATSVGPARVAYFLGGVEDWLFPEYNANNLVDPNQNYAYKMLATPLRGFAQNVRNGTSYAVFNSELRIPIIKYIVNHPIRSTLLENLQVVGFFDAGTAWTGANPFSIENAYNKTIYTQVPFVVTVTSLRDPIVYGYGFGFRTILIGYYLKLDYAWGIEDGLVGRQRTYLSIGYDF
jgi:hypothetical protein